MQLTTIFTVLPLLAVALAVPAPTTTSADSSVSTTVSSSATSKATHHHKHEQKNTCHYHEKDGKYHFHILGLDTVDDKALETDLKTCGGLDTYRYEALSQPKHKHHWKTTCQAPNTKEDAQCVADQLNKVIPKGNDGKPIECKEHKKKDHKNKDSKKND